jgi:two-component system NtrC family response regulator
MILIIDDDNAVRSSLSLLLRQAGYDVATADSPDEALRITADFQPDLFVLDMNFSVGTSGEEGLELLKQLKQACPVKPVILITAWGSIPLAVEGMKAGAADFITKPWSNQRFLESVKTSLSLAGEYGSETPAVRDRRQLDEIYNFEKIVGGSRKILSVLETAGRVSRTDASVLILGESGTGKELMAEAIHENSHRREAPFVKVNLGGVPSTLFESEMFGHKKGAFTGAERDRAGRFEMAEAGTLFLDEVGDLDQRNQVKLLRVLQDRSFEVLGTSTTRSVDFRLICATNRDLTSLLAKGLFREDLFYRINLITLKLPALRQRPEDIPPLVHHFADNLRMIYRRDKLTISPAAIDWLTRLPWPGNVRELKNLVERTVLLTRGDIIDIADFQAQMQTALEPEKMPKLPAVGILTIEEMEKSMIEKAMEFHSNNISKVARSLGLSRAALYRRLEKYGISI